MPAEDLVRLVPVLTGRPQDIEPMLAFWGRLGFVETADYDREYVILCSDPTWEHPVELHLSSWDDHDPYRTAGVVYLRVRDAAAIFEPLKAALEADDLLYLAPAAGITEAHTAELRAMDAAGTLYIRLHELVDQEYGQREFAVIDPAGWLVRVGSPIDP